VKYHIFPHTQSLIPGYFTLDNSAIVDIIGELLGPAEKKEVGWVCGSDWYHSNTMLSKHAAWGILFNQNHKAFGERETWKFRYIARTNGKRRSCTLLYYLTLLITYYG